MTGWRSGIAAGLVGLAVCGCDEPSEIVPVTPPGAIVPRTVMKPMRRRPWVSRLRR